MAVAAVPASIGTIVRLLEEPPSTALEINGVLEDLKAVQSAWKYISAFNSDVEKKGKITSPGREWLCQLRDWTYEAGDFFDLLLSIETKDLGNMEVSNHLRARFEDESFRSKVRDCGGRLRKRFSEISEQQGFLMLEGMADDEKMTGWSQTGSLPTDKKLFGRDKEVRELIRMLKSDDHGDAAAAQVIALVGMGGVGKTALAQHAYNSSINKEVEGIEGFFDVKGWVSVGATFNLNTVTAAALQSITRTSAKPMAMERSSANLDPLQVDLKDQVKGKKFLLVLDSVWDVKADVWEKFITPLENGARGSKILVTTRNMRVARSIARDTERTELKCLSEADSWDMFKSIVFRAGGTEQPGWEQLGKDIAGKCGGLPFAIKLVGRFLSKIPLTDEKWTRDLKYIDEEVEEQLLQPLQWSYLLLPPHLRPCFRYCALFPKNYKICKEDIIRLLMAHDLISHQDKSRKQDDIGKDYIDELLSRSLFQPLEDDLVMHSVVHELAEKISGKEFQRIVSGGNSKDHCLDAEARHLAITSGSRIKSMTLPSCSSIRSLLVLIMDNSSQYARIDLKIRKYEELKCLRVLDLSGSDLQELPDSISVLRLLRFLRLAGTKIKKLPDSISSLCYLQTLDLGHARSFEELPASIGKLGNLNYLILKETQIRQLPESICNLHELQHLDLRSSLIERLPDSIGDMCGLLHLDIQETQICQLPESIKKLHNLKLSWTKTAPVPLQVVENRQTDEHIGYITSQGSLQIRS